MERIDQDYPLSSNPLDLSLEPDYESIEEADLEGLPDTLLENDWWFVNSSIEDPPTEEGVRVTREDWIDFLEELNPEAGRDETYLEEDLETMIDPEEYYYPMNVNLDSFEQTMNDFLFDEDDFYGILPDNSHSYEDPTNRLDEIDDGSMSYISESDRASKDIRMEFE